MGATIGEMPSSVTRATIVVGPEIDYGEVVAKNVMRLREKARLSREDLSEAIGASHSYSWHLETKFKMPSLLMGLRLARVLGVKPEELLAK